MTVRISDLVDAMGKALKASVAYEKAAEESRDNWGVTWEYEGSVRANKILEEALQEYLDSRIREALSQARCQCCSCTV